jgi:Kinesin motor domain
VCAYGATKAGKTHTMQGGNRMGTGKGSERGGGVIQRAAADLFERIEKDAGGRNYKVTAQFFEVYNEQLRDLLAGSPVDEEGRRHGCRSKPIPSEEEEEGRAAAQALEKEEDEEDSDVGDDDTVSLVPPAPSERGKKLSPRKLLHSFAVASSTTATTSAKAKSTRSSVTPPPRSAGAGPPADLPQLQLREVNGVLTIPAVEEEISSVQDVIHLLEHGAKNRAVAKVQAGPGTIMSAQSQGQHHLSSRSHAIFRITVESHAAVGSGSTDPDVATRYVSVLNLVDLAGSENTDRSGTSGLRLREGGTINQRYGRVQSCCAVTCCAPFAVASNGHVSFLLPRHLCPSDSLLSLSRVIHSLSLPPSKRPPHINYRDSKLTRILQPHLSGNACVALLCCVSPSKACVDETRSTLKFAAAARNVETSACVNSFVDHAALIKNLETELSETKQALKTLQCYVDTSDNNNNNNNNNRGKVGVEGSVVSGMVGSVYTEDDWDPFTLGDDEEENPQGAGGRARSASAASANFAGSGDDWLVGGGGSCASSSLHPIQEVLVLSTSMEAPGDAPPADAAAKLPPSTATSAQDAALAAAITRRLEASLRDAELRTSFLEEKLTATDKLVETLFRDLEEARCSNRELRDQLEFWSSQDPPVASLPHDADEGEEHDDESAAPLVEPGVVDREKVKLIKTAFYSATAFYATGQTELFLASVLFMWLSLEGCT